MDEPAANPFASPILTAVFNEVLQLKSQFEQDQAQIMALLVSFIEQESRYQRQVEPLFRIQAMVNDYIATLLGEEIDINRLKDLYLEVHENLRTDFILGRKEFFKSRDFIFDKETCGFIKLDKGIIDELLKNFAKELDFDLSIHQKTFKECISSLKSKTELLAYTKILDSDIRKFNTTQDTIITVKTPFMMKYNDNEQSFFLAKKRILNRGLLAAAQANDQKSCAILLQQQADIDFQDKNGFSILHVVSDETVCHFLIKNGAKLELTLTYTEPVNYSGYTPLHYHISRNNLPIVKELILAGANIAAETSKGLTPLFLAVKPAETPNYEIIRMLAEQGGNFRKRDEDGVFTISCPSMLTGLTDSFKDLTYFAEELLGEQAAHGQQAWNLTNKLQKRLGEMENNNQKLQDKNFMLQTQNKSLTEQVVKLQSMVENLQNIIKGQTINQETSGAPEYKPLFQG